MDKQSLNQGKSFTIHPGAFCGCVYAVWYTEREVSLCQENNKKQNQTKNVFCGSERWIKTAAKNITSSFET